MTDSSRGWNKEVRDQQVMVYVSMTLFQQERIYQKMGRLSKSFVAAITAALLLLTVPRPVLAEIELPAKQTVYMSSKPSRGVYVPIDISGLDSKQKVTKIKSSNKSVIRVDGATRTDAKTVDIFSKSRKLPDTFDSSLHLELSAKKTGKSTISFKVDGKTYKTQISVLKYINPVKSMQFSGVGGTNLKKWFAKDSMVSYELKKNAKAGNLNIVPAAGWVLTSASFEDNRTEKTYKVEGRALASAKIRIPAMKMGRTYTVRAEFVNTKNEGTMSILCMIF